MFLSIISFKSSNSVNSLNFFLSSIKGLADIEAHPSFNSINYNEAIFPIFKVIVDENGIEKEKDTTPDFLLWNSTKKLH